MYQYLKGSVENVKEGAKGRDDWFSDDEGTAGGPDGSPSMSASGGRAGVMLYDFTGK